MLGVHGGAANLVRRTCYWMWLGSIDMMRGGSNAFDVALHRDAVARVRWAASVDARLRGRGIGASLQHFAADSALYDVVFSCSVNAVGAVSPGSASSTLLRVGCVC